MNWLGRPEQPFQNFSGLVKDLQSVWGHTAAGCGFDKVIE
jgi:hypothetical protein